MKKIRFAVVGAGWIGKRHIAAIRSNAEAELVAVCDIRPQEETEADCDRAMYYVDYEQMLEKVGEIDAVCVCTPNGLHAQMAIGALRKGCHVLVEKPMALSLADALMIKKEAEKAGRHAFCVFQNRLTPQAVWLKGLVESGRLGRICMVEENLFWNRDERYYKPGHWHGTADMDGGVLFTQFSHFVDIMLWLFGPVSNVCHRSFNFKHKQSTQFDDSGTAQFEIANGAIGSLNYTTAVWDSNLESSITIIGENGTVKIAGQYMNEVTVCNIRDYSMPALPTPPKPNDYGGYKGSASYHQPVIDNIVSALLHGTQPFVSIEDGVNLVRTVEQIMTAKNMY